MKMSKRKKLVKDINYLIDDVIGFESFIWLITFIMIISFLTGIILGLNSLG